MLQFKKINKLVLFWNGEHSRTSCSRAVCSAAAWRCSGEERREELRQRTRESVVRNPSSPRRVRAGPAGPPEEDPRENHVATGAASVQVTVSWNRFILLPGRAGALTGCWRWRGGGRRAARSGWWYLRRSEILLLTYRRCLIYTASLSGVAEPIAWGEGAGGGERKYLTKHRIVPVWNGIYVFTLRKNSGIYRTWEPLFPLYCVCVCCWALFSYSEAYMGVNWVWQRWGFHYTL